jgi:hypothetical protein
VRDVKRFGMCINIRIEYRYRYKAIGEKVRDMIGEKLSCAFKRNQ